MNVAIITGASSGIGKSFALLSTFYYPEIEEIWLVGRNIKKLKSVADKLNVKSKIISVDLTKDSDIDYFGSLLNKFKPNIKLLVNSAGVGVIGRFDMATREDADIMVKLNCQALTDICYLCIPYMHRNARLINMASAAAFICQSEFAVYAASKSYVLSFSDGIGKELKKKGIYVTAVCPGSVDTPFFNNAEKYQKSKFIKKIFRVKKRSVVHQALWDSKWKMGRSIYGFPMKVFYVLCKFLPLKLLMFFV